MNIHAIKKNQVKSMCQYSAMSFMLTVWFMKKILIIFLIASALIECYLIKTQMLDNFQINRPKLPLIISSRIKKNLKLFKFSTTKFYGKNNLTEQIERESKFNAFRPTKGFILIKIITNLNLIGKPANAWTLNANRTGLFLMCHLW